MSRHRKRRVLPALGVITALALVFIMAGGPGAVRGVFGGTGRAIPSWQEEGYHNSGVPGDVDDDGQVSSPEQSDLSKTESVVRDVLAPNGNGGIAASKGVDSVVVTPAGEQWWRFLTSLAADLTMVDAPAPPGVDWYALTEGRSFSPGSERLVRYSALHLAFPTSSDAEAWLLANAESGASANVYQTLRGRILTITPSWVDVHKEPYGPVDELAASRAQVRVGLWQVDYSEEYRNQIREVTDPQAYQEMWKALGFAGASTWVATSPRPDAEWVGTLEGFDADAVDGFDAVGAINTSMLYCQSGKHECRGPGGGISEAINEVYVVDAKGHGGGEETLMPTDGREDAALMMTYSGAFRGMLNETMSRDSGSIDRFETWVSDSGVLSVRPVFR